MCWLSASFVVLLALSCSLVAASPTFVSMADNGWGITYLTTVDLATFNSSTYRSSGKVQNVDQYGVWMSDTQAWLQPQFAAAWRHGDEIWQFKPNGQVKVITNNAPWYQLACLSYSPKARSAFAVAWDWSYFQSNPKVDCFNDPRRCDKVQFYSLDVNTGTGTLLGSTTLPFHLRAAGACPVDSSGSLMFILGWSDAWVAKLDGSAVARFPAPSGLWSLVPSALPDGGELPGSWLAQSPGALQLWQLSANGTMVSNSVVSTIAPNHQPGFTNGADFAQAQGVISPDGATYATKFYSSLGGEKFACYIGYTSLSGGAGNQFSFTRDPFSQFSLCPIVTYGVGLI